MVREIREQGSNPSTAVAQKVAQRAVHLYIFQADDGRVKVGRSSKPRQRRKSLQQASGLTIATVAIFKDRGDEEQALLLHLRPHRLNGEWHKSSPEFRQALTAYFGDHLDWRQPYSDTKGNEEAERRRIEMQETLERHVLEIIGTPGMSLAERRSIVRREKQKAVAEMCQGPSPHKFRPKPSPTA